LPVTNLIEDGVGDPTDEIGRHFGAVQFGQVALEVDDGIWLVSFMHYDLGYIDLEQRTLQTIDNPFGTRIVTHVLGTICHPCLRVGQIRFGGGEKLETNILSQALARFRVAMRVDPLGNRRGVRLRSTIHGRR